MRVRFAVESSRKMSMSNRTQKKAPIVRLPPKSGFEMFLAHGAQGSLLLLGFVAFVFALDASEIIMAPTSLGIVMGLMRTGRLAP